MDRKRTLINVIIIILVGIVFYVGFNYGLNRNIQYDDNNEFSLEYLNESGHELEIRYVYELSFATSENFEAPKKWDFDEPLFSLLKDGEVVKTILLTDEDRPIIPGVSSVVRLKITESTKSNFLIEINDKIKSKKSLEDLIRFEVRVVVEELRQKRWVPIYQTTLMKRGSYWSLDKGPIEYINTIVN